MTAMIDLHTHSTASDGSYSPRELVKLAAQAGITRLAITDHDTLDGLASAMASCEKHEVSLVNGIELSCRFGNRSLHIVGLDIDPENEELNNAVFQSQQIRIKRGRIIGQKLEKSGISNAYKSTCELAGSNLIGRAHFARVLVEQGYAKNFKQVFKRYMTQGKPGYAAAQWMALETAINVIHAAGGLAVIAHPARYGLSRGQLRRLVEDFRDLSGDAIEVVSGKASPGEIENLARLAGEFSLAGSVGSDFHGPDKPWVKLGKLPQIPKHCVPVWSLRELW